MSEIPSPRTYKQISEQLEAGHANPSVLIERGNKDIQAARLTGRHDERGRQYVSFETVDPATGDIVSAEKPISQANLADERQEELADNFARSVDRGLETWNRTAVAPKLGGEVLEQTGMAAPTKEANAVYDPYAHLFSSEESDQLGVEVAAKRFENNPMDTARAAADAKYNEVMKATGNDEAATAASDRVYDEMMRQQQSKQ